VLRGGYGIYFSTPRSGASGTGPWGFEGYDEQTGWSGILKRNGQSIESSIDRTGVDPNAPPPGSYFANAAVDPTCGCPTGVLSVPAPYTLGSAPRVITNVRQPGTRNTTLSLFKEFSIREGKRLEYRLEAFNAFNHPHFNGPDSGVDSPTFARSARWRLHNAKSRWRSSSTGNE